jgi:hypothetical protein
LFANSSMIYACSLELLQFCMLIHKIQRNVSKIPSENSNFCTYLGCPHYVCMRKSEKSPGKKNWDNELSLNSVDGCSSFQGRDTKLDRFLAQHSMGNSH